MPGPLFSLYTLHNITDSNCTEGIQWIYNTFGDCVETNLEYASVIIGLISIVIWMGVGFPQMYNNCKHSEMVEGLSVMFILFWLSGDSCNLTGCILSHQLPVQMYTAIYYVFADVILLCQYTFFRCRSKRQISEITGNVSVQEPGINSGIILCLGSFLIFSSSLSLFTLPLTLPTGVHDISHQNPRFIPTGRHLLSSDLTYSPIFKGPVDEVGYAIGILSFILYVSGRFFQIFNNYKRQSAEGMSMIMFLMAILGNITYGMSILMRRQDTLFLVRHLPWLMGSIGVMNFDAFILCQAIWYKRKARVIGELGNPLLCDTD